MDAAAAKREGGESVGRVCVLDSGEEGVLGKARGKQKGARGRSCSKGSGGMFCEAPLHPSKQRTAAVPAN